MLPCFSQGPSELNPEQKVLLKLFKTIMSLAEAFPDQTTALNQLIQSVQTDNHSAAYTIEHMIGYNGIGPWGYSGLLKVFSAIAQVLESRLNTETTALLARSPLPPVFRHMNFLPEQIDPALIARIQRIINYNPLSEAECGTLRMLLSNSKQLQQAVKTVAALPLPVLQTELGWQSSEDTKAAKIVLQLFRELLSYGIHEPYKVYWVLALFTVIAFIVTVVVALFLNVENIQSSAARLNNGTEPSAREVLHAWGPERLIMQRCSDSMPREEYESQQCHSSPMFYIAVATMVVSLLGSGGAAARKRYQRRAIASLGTDEGSIQEL